MSDPFDSVMPPGRGAGDQPPPGAADALRDARRAAAELTASATTMDREQRMDACDHTVAGFWRDRGFELDDGIYLHDFDGEVIGELRGVRRAGQLGEPLAHVWLDYGHSGQQPDDLEPFARLWRPLPDL